MAPSEVELTIPGYLPEVNDEQRKEIESLIWKFNNARRRAYQMQRKQVSESEGPKILQEDTGLNSRYVNEVWWQVSKLPFFVVFGGKKNKRLLDEGKIGKEEWHEHRNRILLSRGDSFNKGNVNLRVIEEDGDLRLRINIGFRKWIYPKLYVPDKYLERYGHLLDGSKPYQVLVKRRSDGKYEVKITVRCPVELEEGNRLLALDLNSGHIDWAVVEKNGTKLLETGRINLHQILDSSGDKSKYFIYKAIEKVGNLAEHHDADVLVGKLNTGRFSSWNSKANRRIKLMSQYEFRRILRYKLALRGIKVMERSEAWTSKVGKIFSEHLGLDVHKASAYAFAIKILAYHRFMFLCRVLSIRMKEDGIPDGEGKALGSGLTALLQSEAAMKALGYDEIQEKLEAWIKATPRLLGKGGPRFPSRVQHSGHMGV